ncbi:MAG: hypothetical protein V4754_00700 [Pseudomonadota bacterium]
MAILSTSQSAAIADTQGWVPPAPPPTPQPAAPAARGNRNGVAAMGMVFGMVNSSATSHSSHLQHALLGMLRKQQEKEIANNFLQKMSVAADAFERAAREAGDAFELTGRSSTDITPAKERDGITASVLKGVDGIPAEVRQLMARRIEYAPFPPLAPGERPASIDAYLEGIFKSAKSQGEVMLMALDYFDRAQAKLAKQPSAVFDHLPGLGSSRQLTARDAFLQKMTLSCVMLAQKFQDDVHETTNTRWSAISAWGAAEDNVAARVLRSSQCDPKEIGTMQSRVWALLDHQCAVPPDRFKRQIAALQADLAAQK